MPPLVLALAGFRHGSLLREVDEEERAELEKRERSSLKRRGSIGKQVQRIMAVISARLGARLADG